MTIKTLEAAIESILFASGDYVEVDRLCQALEVEKQTVLSVLAIISDKCRDESRGVELLKLENSYQLCTKPQFSQYIKKALGKTRQMSLSQAALETLSIIAYNQPTTRAYVDQIRGVDSSQVISNLVDKGLIEENGRLDVPGRPRLYVTTLDFLRCFGLSSIEDLPELPLPPEKEDE